MESIGTTSIFSLYPDADVVAASVAHRVADVEVAGTVVGSPTYFLGRRTHALHESFPIVTEHGLRLNVIDNVDLAPRVQVVPGDVVAIAGQFIPSRRGGIIHDTHHSPGPGWHRGGWIEYHGRRYEGISISRVTGAE